MRRRTRFTVEATVSPGTMRRFTVALACDGSTLAAVPPDCIVAATVVRTSAAGSPPMAANTRPVSGGTTESRRYRNPGAPGVCSAKRASIAEIAFGACGRNVPGPRRSSARPMRRTAVMLGGADAWPPSPRVDSSSVISPFSATPTMAA